MAQLKLILLDFDGTLADTRYANADAYIEALSEVGISLDRAT
jgi:beta-phosphoglucomutase-like phosphatase (HAD superfamily)